MVDDLAPDSHFWSVDEAYAVCGMPVSDDLILSPTPSCLSCKAALEHDARMLAQLLKQDVIPQMDGVLRLALSASVLAPHLRHACLSAIGDAEVAESWGELSIEQKEFWLLRARAVVEMFISNPKQPTTTEQFNRDVQRTLKLVK